MSFHKSIAGRIRAGNKSGKAGLNAAKSGRLRRWTGTIPTAYWRVSGIAADATTLPDTSKAGNGLDGTLGGTVDQAGSDSTWNTECPPGSFQSLRFDGTSNKLTIPYNAAIKPSNNKVSISMWIKTTSNNTYLIVSETDEDSATAGWVYGAIGVGTPNKANVYWNNTGAAWRSSSSDVNDDKWHNIVFVYDGSAANEISTYIDGVLEDEDSGQSGNLVLANVPLLLGYRRASGAVYYQYYMDEIAYWTDIALTADQVKDLYNLGRVPNSTAGIQRG